MGVGVVMKNSFGIDIICVVVVLVDMVWGCQDIIEIGFYRYNRVEVIEFCEKFWEGFVEVVVDGVF